MKEPTFLSFWLALSVVLTSTQAHSGHRTFQPADFALGQLSQPGTVYLRKPFGVAVDPATGKVFVADSDHSRVLRFASTQTLTSGAQPEAVFGQPNFSSTTYGIAANKIGYPVALAFTNGGFLWVADFYASRVLRFDNASTRPSGGTADGVLGQPDFVSSSFGLSASRFLEPVALAGYSSSLYVVDKYARVLRFSNAAQKPNGASADAVFGQPDFVTGTTGLTAQKFGAVGGIALEPPPIPFTNARLWVSDMTNNRVLGFDNSEAVTGAAGPATHVLGQPDFTSGVGSLSATKFMSPQGLAVVPTVFGRSLYVGDGANHRVLRFDDPGAKPNGAPANGVLGQVGFNTASSNGPIHSIAQFCAGEFGALWIAASHSHLVLRFNQWVPQPAGGTYDLVLGGGGTNPAEFPLRGNGIAIDPASGKVFVSVDETNEVLRFPSYASLHARSAPEAVFGGGPGNSYANSMLSPLGLAIDEGGRLWVADAGNSRVLRFENAAYRAGGQNADGVLGQPGFGSSTPATGASHMNHPSAVVATDSTLWVVDTDNHRVLRFDNAAAKPNGAPANGVLGQINFTNTAVGLSFIGMNQPVAAAQDARGRLWVLDGGNNRVLRYDDAATKQNGAGANGVLGQPNFVSNTPGTSVAKIAATHGSVVVDRTGRLYVGEETNHRVTWFNRAAAKPNGAAADGVLGQPGFVTSNLSFDEHHLGNVYGLCLDPEGSLWAVDHAYQRILRFRSTVPAIETFSLNAFNHAYLQIGTVAGDKYEVLSSKDLKIWADASPELPATGNVLYWLDGSVAQGTRFYRVIELPE